ncbi:phospholipid phosphatase 5 isoform X2 [Episyrphus balteatus]|uniref:phospholipid phosphatase 5 isoform X2 n=1 Tax=Episyrphus balteatus TaxID=286459 RepID=UPI002484D8EA|nr:phospholipid phosphatase 5 isoform X2 [Episyrphus balteatus]
MLSSSSSLNDQDVKLRHRNAMTVSVSATTTSQPEKDPPYTGDIIQDKFHTEQKSATKKQLVEDHHCCRKSSDLLSNSSSSVKSSAKSSSLMEKPHRRQTLSESSDESQSNQVTTVGDCMEYRGKSSGDTMRPNSLQRQTSATNSTGVAASQSSILMRYVNIFVEIAVRVLLVYGTAQIERIPPFKRKIFVDEVWLYRNPTTEDYVSGKVFLICTLIAPPIVILLNFLYSRNRRDLGQGFYAYTLGITLCQFLTSLLKISVGRPRPDFLQRCFPDGIIGDFDHCTGDIRVVNEGRKSFPSGHSALTFAGLCFISYYLAGKLHIFNQRGRASGWRLILSIAPLVFALEVAVSRTCDYHHHWQDVVVGSIMGICISYLCYRSYYPSIFDEQCHKPHLSKESVAKIKENGFVLVQKSTNSTG